ncbi:hypothetical protein Tco_0647541 [Tanacetum coccineum]
MSFVNALKDWAVGGKAIKEWAKEERLYEDMLGGWICHKLDQSSAQQTTQGYDYYGQQQSQVPAGSGPADASSAFSVIINKSQGYGSGWLLHSMHLRSSDMYLTNPLTSVPLSGYAQQKVVVVALREGLLISPCGPDDEDIPIFFSTMPSSIVLLCLPLHYLSL